MYNKALTVDTFIFNPVKPDIWNNSEIFFFFLMEQFIEPLNNMFLKVCMLSIIFDASGFYGSYSEKMELILKRKNHISFIQRLKLSKNVQFDADTDIYMAKK